MITICSVLEAELRESISKRNDNAPEEDENGLSKEAESLFPALRIYCMWLAASRAEVFDDKEPDRDAVMTMTQTICRVFTLLCVETYNKDNIVSCPYLLTEDLDILGFLPLSGTQVPDACRVFCLETGPVKPHLFSDEQRLPPATENMARILDILRCAYFLAEDADIPLACNVVENWLVFEHQPDSARGQSQRVLSPPFDRRAQDVRSDTAACGQGSRSMPVKPQDERPVLSKRDPADGKESPRGQEGNVGDAENTVINMLAPFLRPPTPDLQNAKNDQESSYGMHTATANELLGSFQTDPSPSKSIPSGKFEPLPWDWFNTPKPLRGDAAAPANLSGTAAQRSPGMSPNAGAANTGRFEDPFYAPNLHQNGYNGIGNRAAIASTAESSHRAQLLQPLAGGAARTSPFSQWGEERNIMMQGNIQRHSPPGLQGPADSGFPQSSSASAFSHPSSLYQGTPATNGVGMNYSLSADLGGGRAAYNDGVRSSVTAQRPFRTESTTSSYDEAILRAAYQGKK